MEQTPKFLALLAFAALVSGSAPTAQVAPETANVFESLWQQGAIAFNSVTGQITLNDNLVEKMVLANMVESHEVVVALHDSEHQTY